jgi:hypothetical protein
MYKNTTYSLEAPCKVYIMNLYYYSDRYRSNPYVKMIGWFFWAIIDNGEVIDGCIDYQTHLGS